MQNEIMDCSDDDEDHHGCEDCDPRLTMLLPGSIKTDQAEHESNRATCKGAKS